MRKKGSKSGMLLRVLIVPLLLVGMLVFIAAPISADEGLIKDESGIRTADAGGGEPVEPLFSSADGGITIFEQPPITPSDPWAFYTSDTTPPYLCMDDFWGLTSDIGGISWYGLTLFWSGGWFEGDPSGMQFEIIFYEDSGGSPGATVATFSNVSPDLELYDTFAGFQAYRFDVNPLPSPVSLTEGWVSIQSTSSPSSSWLLWGNSLAGNLNATQNGGSLSDNLAFALTGAEAVGGEVFQINKLSVLAPWLALALVLAVGGVWFVMRRRQAH